jgi:uncharacterized membrane protein
MPDLTDLKVILQDLVDVEPRSIGSDTQAREASVWVEIQKQTEGDVDNLLDPAIKDAYAAHRKLTGEKKSLLEKLLSAKDRVRVGLANWIAGGHAVKGCYIKTTWRVTVVDAAKVPEEYHLDIIDEKKLKDWVVLTEGKQGVPGVTIEPINILYSQTEK